MPWKRLFLLALATACPVAASSKVEPCEQIRQIYEKSQDAASKISVPGGLAYDCLQTMPFHSEGSTQFVQELRKWMQWHSTIDTLKKPPTGYTSPPVDIPAGLDEIEANATKSLYKSQFDFDQGVDRLLRSAHDQHLRMDTCANIVFEFHVDFPLVSVSSDGLEVPEIFAFADVPLLSKKLGPVSRLESINGKNAVTFLNAFGLYNALFHAPNRFISSTGSTSVSEDPNRGSWEYNDGTWPGSTEFELKFANGTTRNIKTTAQFKLGLKFPYKDGKDLMKDFCLSKGQQPILRKEMASLMASAPTQSTTPMPSSSSATRKVSSSASPTRAASSPASVTTPLSSEFPTAVVRTEDESLSGYYPKGKDLAVLYIGNFSPQDGMDFSHTATEFIQKAKSAGKKKLIIDLSFNRGGTIAVGLDLFRLFFPNKELLTETRFRAHETMDLIGKALAHEKVNPDTDAVYDSFTVAGILSPHQKKFDSWSDIYGPHKEQGSSMSSLVTQMNFTLESIRNKSIRGYGPVKLNETEPPFAADDILIVTNGVCGSTCTIFSELMKYQAGVKSLAFGGRPRTGKMQTLGSTKGQMVMAANTIELSLKKANGLAANSTRDGHPVLSETERKRLKELTPLPFDNLTISGLDGLNLNFVNGYRPDHDDTPLQFIYEPAECRLFFTAENILHPETTWRAAAHAFWEGGPCVKDSTSKA
ncbi:peptidase S41 family protein [Penicillium capsulatum]|nr:peptidase S41 family protein [Penicillium capsulatum]